MIYISTDYVFGGAKREPYMESDPLDPLSVYGASKAAGEHATAEANANHLIVRSSWLALGRERDALWVVDDQVGCPTFTGHLADALLPLAASDQRGILHAAGASSRSWFEFAREIFGRAGIEADLQPCSTEQFPRPARRPANSVLGSERGGPTLPTWQDGLDAYLGVPV